MNALPSNDETRDLLRVADLTPARLTALLDHADELKRAPHSALGALGAEGVACLVGKPSRRMRASFEVAAHRVGLLPIILRAFEFELGRGESLADTARVLAGDCAAIVMHAFAQATVRDLADAAEVPVINARTDTHHPCQVLGDLMTLREHFGRLAGLHVAYVGDGQNVAHSLMEAGALAGMHVAVATPRGYEPLESITEAAMTAASATGGTILLTDDPRSAVEEADVVYTDGWLSTGEPEENGRRVADLRAFQVNAQLMSVAAPEAVFLHCLPVHRGQEVTAEIVDGPRSLVWRQAANQLPTEQAILLTFIGAHDGP